MARAKVAELAVEKLVGAGFRRVYGLSGDSLNGITDAIRKRTNVSWVHVRHEEAAAFAAGAEAHLTGELTACAGSCGPGIHESEVPDSKVIGATSQGWPHILSSLKSLLETGESLEATRTWPNGL